MNMFSDPLKIIDQLQISQDAHIADFGCGTGIYSLALARENPLRKIFAIDVKKDMLERLEKIIDSKNLSHLHVIWGDIDEVKGSRLRDNSIDFVILANTLFQLENKKTAIIEIFRILKQGGSLLVVDWSDSFGNIGPKEDHVVNENTAKLLVEENGFLIKNEIEAGAHHYGFVARKI